MPESKKRILDSIKFRSMDHVPFTFRGTESITVKLMNYFGIANPTDFMGNKKELIKRPGADM